MGVDPTDLLAKLRHLGVTVDSVDSEVPPELLPPEWVIRWQRRLDQTAERWFAEEPTVRAAWDGEAVSVEWSREAVLGTAVRLLARVLSRHHGVGVSRLALGHHFVPGKIALPESSITDFARGLASLLVIPNLDVLVLVLPEIGASHVATTAGSAVRGSLIVDLPGFDPEALMPLAEELDREVPEHVIGPSPLSVTRNRGTMTGSRKL